MVSTRSGRILSPPIPRGYRKSSVQKECPICYERYKENEFIVLDCRDRVCRKCLSRYCSLSISEGRTKKGTLKCPMENCNFRIQGNRIKELVSDKDWAKHRRFVRDTHLLMITSDHARLCVKPECIGIAYTIMLTDSRSPSNQVDIKRQLKELEYHEAQCQSCHYRFCHSCGADPHPQTTCDHADNGSFFKWKARKAVKPCPGCKLQIEKRGGCNYMSCSQCHTYWCWNCGKKSQSCRCYGVLMHAAPLLEPGEAAFIFYFREIALVILYIAFLICGFYFLIAHRLPFQTAYAQFV